MASTVSTTAATTMSTGNSTPKTIKDLGGTLPQSKFEINYKDKNQLIKDIHYIANHLFPLSNDPYTTNTNLSQSKYTLKVISGGITNLLYLMTPITIDDNPSDDMKTNNQIKACKKLLIRVYGENTEILIDRAREEVLFYELGELGFGPKLYATFGNGRMEQFYDNAHTVKLNERKCFIKIGNTLADMHCINPKLLRNEVGSVMLWNTVDKWFNIASNIEFKDDNDKQTKFDALNWNNIEKQINIMKHILPSNKNNNNQNNELFQYIISKQSNDNSRNTLNQQFNDNVSKLAHSFMFDSVFSHNDLLGGNILHLADTQEIKFVDFEYGGYNFRGFDFANHFCEYAGFDCDWKKHFPAKNHMSEFIQSYIKCLCDNNIYKEQININIVNLFNDNTKQNEQNKFLNICVEIVLIFSCVDHYFWGLWGVVQAKHSPINFDFIKYANDRLVSGYKHASTLLPDYLKFVIDNK